MTVLSQIQPRLELPPALPLHAELIPVVAIHGTFGSPGNFLQLSLTLQGRGIPVFGPSYAGRGVLGIKQGTAELKKFLLGILESCPQVDLVAHSQGGMQALALSQDPDLSGRIRTLVGLGACFKGMPNTIPEWLKPLILEIGGPSYLELCDPAFAPEPVVPDTVRLVSLVSTADLVVPFSSSELGEVRVIAHYPHTQLPKAVRHILPALGYPLGADVLPTVFDKMAALPVLPTNTAPAKITTLRELFTAFNSEDIHPRTLRQVLNRLTGPTAHEH